MLLRASKKKGQYFLSSIKQPSSNMAGIDQPFFPRDGELRQNSPNSISFSFFDRSMQLPCSSVDWEARESFFIYSS